MMKNNIRYGEYIKYSPIITQRKMWRAAIN